MTKKAVPASPRIEWNQYVVVLALMLVAICPNFRRASAAQDREYQCAAQGSVT